MKIYIGFIETECGYGPDCAVCISTDSSKVEEHLKKELGEYPLDGWHIKEYRVDESELVVL